MQEKENRNLKENIIQKAWGLIKTKQNTDFSLREISKSLKISPATPYIYYKNKEDVIITICERIVENMQHFLNNSNERKHFLKAYCDFAFNNPTDFKLLFDETTQQRNNEKIKIIAELINTKMNLNQLDKAYYVMYALNGYILFNINSGNKLINDNYLEKVNQFIA